MHGAARSASLIQMQRARPRRPVPLLIGATDSTPWSRAVAPDAFPFVILGRARQRRVEGRGSSTKLVEDTPLGLPPGSTNEIGQCQNKIVTAAKAAVYDKRPTARRLRL
ncbi:hypothetical protein Hden_0263 [Hyphomicrobium denitrificans ATCC 51888]|uniref:Uncharacterized protein n=1 Tax=Hyphomicrobium denitrificans (strain ATCC 51888 / DSM 1869 / NCIMB 11706 / TK 0415) TaxID=582899 RepID=D8JQT6_HYPDA|nr:hypothetical protein Hden_0263 [Hyphomicrobium denitrificans ATCC 51888]